MEGGRGSPSPEGFPFPPPILLFFHNLKPGFNNLRGDDGARPEEAKPAVFHALDERGRQTSGGNGRLVKDAHDRSDQLFVELLDADDGGVAADVRAAGGDGLAYGLRRALLDEMTITEGVEYERYVAEWLAHNPGKTRLDVPQLTVDLKGARIVIPGDVASEYQIRVPVTSVEEMHIQNEKIYMLIVEFGLNTPNPLRFPLYAPERVCKIVPQAGDEIDAIIWLQGRIID